MLPSFKICLLNGALTVLLFSQISAMRSFPSNHFFQTLRLSMDKPVVDQKVYFSEN